MFILILTSNHIIDELKKLKTFLHLMFIEFCSQKWGKAASLACLTLIVAENKDWLLALADNNRLVFLFLFFVAYWLRFYLAEFIPKNSAQEMTLHHADLKKLKEDTRITITPYKDTRMFGGGFKIHWLFTHSLRTIPIVNLRSYTLCERLKHYTPHLELKYESHEASKTKLEIALHFHIASFTIDTQEPTLEGIFESLELSVDARPFPPNCSISPI